MTQQFTRPAQLVETGNAARFVGQSVRRREDPRLLTGRGRYVDDVTMPRMLHAHFVRSPVARGTLDGLDVVGGARTAGRPRRVHRGGRELARAVDVELDARPGRRRPATAGARRRRRPLRRRTDRDRHRPIARSCRGRGRARRVRRRGRQPGGHDRPRRRPGRAGAPGARLELLRRARAGRPAATGAAVRVGRARDLRALHAAPLRLRADGATRPRGSLGPVGRDARGRRVDADCARVAGSLVAAARRARGRRSGRHGRRRRQLRAEDVPRARGPRRRHRGEAARPAGQVDRGPVREPDRRRPRPRGDDGRLVRLRRRRHPVGRQGPAPRERRRLPEPRRRHGRVGGGAGLPRPVPNAAPRVRGEGRLHEHVRALRLPRPVDDGDRRPRAARSTSPHRSSASTRSKCADAT